MNDANDAPSAPLTPTPDLAGGCGALTAPAPSSPLPPYDASDAREALSVQLEVAAQLLDALTLTADTLKRYETEAVRIRDWMTYAIPWLSVEAARGAMEMLVVPAIKRAIAEVTKGEAAS